MLKNPSVAMCSVCEWDFVNSRERYYQITKYVPNSCRLCRALGGAEKVEIEWGNHSLSNRVAEAVQAIIDFVIREGPKGWDDPWN